MYFLIYCCYPSLAQLPLGLRRGQLIPKAFGLHGQYSDALMLAALPSCCHYGQSPCHPYLPEKTQAAQHASVYPRLWELFCFQEWEGLDIRESSSLWTRIKCPGKQTAWAVVSLYCFPPRRSLSGNPSSDTLGWREPKPTHAQGTCISLSSRCALKVALKILPSVPKKRTELHSAHGWDFVVSS